MKIPLKGLGQEAKALSEFLLIFLYTKMCCRTDFQKEGTGCPLEMHIHLTMIVCRGRNVVCFGQGTHKCLHSALPVRSPKEILAGGT